MYISTLAKIGCAFLAVVQALPLNPAESATSLKAREPVDEDDKVVYAYPEPKTKREVDEDDKVVYAWALPESKTKRDVDEDDKVVYAWALPEKA